VGNLRSKAGVEQVYKANTHQLASVAGVAYQYDSAGQITHINDVVRARWTAFNMPAQLFKGDNAILYQYDGDLNRVLEVEEIRTGSTSINTALPQKRSRMYYFAPGSVEFLEQEEAFTSNASGTPVPAISASSMRVTIGSPDGTVAVINQHLRRSGCPSTTGVNPIPNTATSIRIDSGIGTASVCAGPAEQVTFLFKDHLGSEVEVLGIASDQKRTRQVLPVISMSLIA
jgi:hypothetical protein